MSVNLRFLFSRQSSIRLICGDLLPSSAWAVWCWWRHGWHRCPSWPSAADTGFVPSWNLKHCVVPCWFSASIVYKRMVWWIWRLALYWIRWTLETCEGSRLRKNSIWQTCCVSAAAVGCYITMERFSRTPTMLCTSSLFMLSKFVQKRAAVLRVPCWLNPISPHPDYITLAHNNHVSLFTFIFTCIISISEARPNKRYHFFSIHNLTYYFQMSSRTLTHGAWPSTSIQGPVGWNVSPWNISYVPRTNERPSGRTPKSAF